MKNIETYLPQHFYKENLQVINGVKFTRREIDIVSFIINGRSTKKIASFFSLSPRTIDNYIHNIMLKLDCNSRELIIDFIEKSKESHLIRQHYFFLHIRNMFEACLNEISKRINPRETAVFLFHRTPHDILVSQLEKDLKLCGIRVFDTQQKRENMPNVLCFHGIDESEKTTDHYDIKVNLQNYYESVFIILKKFYPDEKCDLIISEFRRKCEFTPPKTINPTSLPTESKTYANPNVVKMLLCLTIFLSICAVFYFRHIFERDHLLNEKNLIQTSWTNHYEPHFNQAITHAKFYQWRGNALNINFAKKISEEVVALKDTLEKDINKITQKRELFANNIFIMSPLNWRLYREIVNMLHNQEADLSIAVSFNKVSQKMSHDTFLETITELDNHAIYDLNNEASKLEKSNPRKEILNTYLAIAVNMKNGVAKKRLFDIQEDNKLEYIKEFEALLKELSLSASTLDEENFYTYINMHRINTECALREENPLKKKQFEDVAKAALNKSIELAQHEAPVLQEMAYHYKYTKENNRALLAYDSALKIEPNHSGLLYGRAELYLKMGEESNNTGFFKRALNDIKKANSLKINDCDMLHLLVWASLHADTCEQAFYVFENRYKPLCVVGTEDWDDMSGIRDEDVKWLQKKLDAKCKTSKSS